MNMHAGPDHTLPQRTWASPWPSRFNSRDVEARTCLKTSCDRLRQFNYEARQKEYNKSCPHRSLGDLTSDQFASEVAASPELVVAKGVHDSP